MRLAFDIESDGLLDGATKVHSLCLMDVDDKKLWSCSAGGSGWNIQEGLALLFQATEIIGHNILTFDLPLLLKLYGWKPNPNTKLTDTLILSRLIYSDLEVSDYVQLKKNPQWLPGKLIGRHSLKAWGCRLGELKGDFGETADWAAWSPEMQSYCERDVEVAAKLFQQFEALHYSPVAIRLEHEFQQVIFLMEQFGFALDEKAAHVLWAKLVKVRDDLTLKLQSVFPPKIETMKEPEYYYLWERPGGRCGGLGETCATKANGKRLARQRGWADYVITDGPLRTKVHPFNPGSRKSVAEELMKLGWKPKKFTPSGAPQIDEEVLDEVLATMNVPEAKLLNEYMTVQKRLGMLSEGKQSFLKNVKNGRLHQSVNTNGAVTGRCTHRIIVNVPKAIAEVPWGIEMRSCLIADPGRVLVGADASGLELRMLGHFLAQYDGGDFAREVGAGDVHMRNTIALGLEPTKANRNTVAKTWIYAYIYGAGDENLGSIQGVTPEEIAHYQMTEKKRWTKAKTRLTRDKREYDEGVVATMVKGSIQRERFENNTPALKLLKAAMLLKTTVVSSWNQWQIAEAKGLLEEAGFPVPKYTGSIKGLDGRILHIRSSHSALNALLQSAGILCVKQATIIQYQKLLAQGFICNLETIWKDRAKVDFCNVGQFHDENQTQSRPEIADKVGIAFVEGCAEAGVFFKLKVPLTGEYKSGKNWADTH